ncbi:hypothetical protein VP01_5415g1 [Puccinia sorghi]|uniref:Retrovirus-related Pol polyprotein from transposon TNT 1-94-like beta-barrel domain-containing protein n=1 Tax=Puccinia sorghi TaxID=27349 RepID=A0A0L6UJU2_9BASI|nr:hypothetical protein VP01_5415g1 [Puccinia sorghi]
MLFISHEQGVVRTSSGEDLLEIKGIGSVKLTHEHGEMFLHQVLYVPNLVINLLSVRCLALKDYNVQFLKHSFTISRNDNFMITGHYEGNLPCLNLSNVPSLRPPEKETNTFSLLWTATQDIVLPFLSIKRATSLKPYQPSLTMRTKFLVIILRYFTPIGAENS